MPLFRPVPNRVRPTYVRLLALSLYRAPGLALLGDLASLIAVKSLNAPPWEVALIAAAPPLGNLLAIFWSKQISLSPKKTLYAFWPEAITSALVVAMMFARDSHTFTIGLCSYLLLRAPLLQAHSAIWRANYPAHWRSWLVARAMAFSELLTAGAGLVFGFLLDFNPTNYRGLLALAGACGLLGAFQVTRIRIRGEGSAKPADKAGADFSLRRIMGVLKKDHRFRRYEFSFSIFGFANIMVMPIMPMFLDRELGIRYNTAGLILVTMPMIIDVIMLPLWGRLLDKHNPLLMRAIFNAIFSFGMLCFPLAGSLWVFAAGRAIIALVQGGSSLVWYLGINYFARREEVPVYMGLHQSLTGIRGLIAPFVGIAMAYWLHSYRAVFFAAFLLMIFGTLVMIGEVMREHKRSGGRLPSFAQAESETDRRFSA
jgi:hypothetical protein